jgi:hypothetical protein
LESHFLPLVRNRNPAEKSAQRGQINTADLRFDFPVKKTCRAKKSCEQGRLRLFLKSGCAGCSEMVFDLLNVAKPSASGQINLQMGRIKTKKNILYSTPWQNIN